MHELNKNAGDLARKLWRMSYTRISDKHLQGISGISLLVLISYSAFFLPQFSTAAEAPAKPVLPSDNIFGNAKIGYMAAKRVPEVCEKLFCYCGCDLSDAHSTLLDCFTSDHGVDCNICQEEAIIALKMQTEGKTIAEIQKAVDQKYVAEYNSVFEQPSEMLKKYREQRLWKPTPAELALENSVGKKNADSSKSSAEVCKPNEAGTAGAAKVKPDNSKKSARSCCGKK